MKRIGRSVTVVSVFLAMILPAACLGIGGGDGGGGGPRQCLPAVESDDGDIERDPECESCVQRSCDLDDECADPCETFYDCTCDCDPDDSACFSACDDERTPSCDSCQEASSEEFVSCVQDSCADACGLSSADGALPGGDDDDDDDDDGFPFPDDDDDDDDDDDSSGDDCEELAACCPMLSGIDRDLCEDADEPFECELWLDIFREEGSC